MGSHRDRTKPETNLEKCLLCAALLFFTVSIPSTAVQAQGEYLWGRSSGLEIGGGVYGSNEHTVYHASLGVSLYGSIDLSGHFGRHNHSGYIEDAGGGALTLWVLKEGQKKRPFSLGITTSVESQNSDPIIFSGLTLTKRIMLRNTRVFFLPKLALGMHWGVPHNKQRIYLWTIYDDDQAFGATLGLAFALPLAQRSCLVLAASHTVVDDAHSTGGKVSIVFGKFWKD